MVDQLPMLLAGVMLLQLGCLLVLVLPAAAVLQLLWFRLSRC
jgi:hypothetical protein